MLFKLTSYIAMPGSWLIIDYSFASLNWQMVEDVEEDGQEVC